MEFTPVELERVPISLPERGDRDTQYPTVTFFRQQVEMGDPKNLSLDGSVPVGVENSNRVVFLIFMSSIQLRDLRRGTARG